MKTELVRKLGEILQKDAADSSAEVRSLQKEYQKLWASEFENAKQAFIDEGGSAKDFHYQKQPEDIQFEELLDKINKAKKENDAKLAAEQARNLYIRQDIIAKIRDLSHLSENVGAAVRKLQELQTQWKETGPVSTHKYKEVQADYSRAVEDIYYNLKIFRDLQEHDLKKNLELKTALIEKLRGLQALENTKEAERLIKIYRNEWDEIGPVPNAKWEVLKHDYKIALDETYSKIKAYYHSVEEQKEVNLQSKLAIIEKVKTLIESLTEARATRWNEATEKVIALQAEWKAVGRTTEKDNEKIWGDFRQLCDSFFEKKKEFFSSLNEKFAANRKIKSELIARAEELQLSTDWQKTGPELIKLQDTWKKYPGNGDKDEPKLFARFRKACNTFFDARKQHYESIDASYEQNLVVKEQILERFREFKAGEDLNSNRELIKNFSNEWNAVGHVPIKDKKRMNEAFYNRMDELYDQMQIDKSEKSIMQFSIRLQRLMGSENGPDLLVKESDHLRKQIDEINSRLRTYENNLGFFNTSKGSNSFVKEIEDKISGEKARIAELASKRKLISEQLTKLRNGDKARAEA